MLKWTVNGRTREGTREPESHAKFTEKTSTSFSFDNALRYCDSAPSIAFSETFISDNSLSVPVEKEEEGCSSIQTSAAEERDSNPGVAVFFTVGGDKFSLPLEDVTRSRRWGIERGFHSPTPSTSSRLSVCGTPGEASRHCQLASDTASSSSLPNSPKSARVKKSLFAKQGSPSLDIRSACRKIALTPPRKWKISKSTTLPESEEQPTASCSTFVDSGSSVETVSPVISVKSSEEITKRNSLTFKSLTKIALKSLKSQSKTPTPRATSTISTSSAGTSSLFTPASFATSTPHPGGQRTSAMASALPDLTAPQIQRQDSVSRSGSDLIGPEVEWEQEDVSLDEAAREDRLPCVALFEENVSSRDSCGHEGQGLSAGLKIYSRQPVLFHTRTRKKQARARTIYRDKGGSYFEIGQTIIIPGDYEGWFELVPSDFSRATCYTSIGELAKNMPQKFFTRSNVKGIRIEGEGEGQKFLERKIPAGSVLGTRGTFKAKWKTQAVTGVFKKKTKEWEFQEVTYLKCLDKDGKEVLVPLSHRGKFNAIYERGQLTQNAVYSMKDILTDLSLPIKVRLLFGKAPVVPCIFTGMLVIRDAVKDEAIVGSTLLNTRNVLFEIPIHAPVKAKWTSNDEAFKEMDTYKDAKKLCKKYANMFSTMIKLSPDLDTDQKVILHVPSDPSLMREADEVLRALDLITDISLTGEHPQDHLIDSSDNGSMSSEDQAVMPKEGMLAELSEYKTRESQTHV